MEHKAFNKENDFMKVWVIDNYNGKQWNIRHSINIEVLTRKEPHVSHLAFYNAEIVLMGKYFPNMIFFNFNTVRIDVLQLTKGLLHVCFLFRSNFIVEEGV
jgi:hypothetical protein